MSQIDAMGFSNFRCSPVSGYCFAPLSLGGRFRPKNPMCFTSKLISSQKYMCFTWLYRFLEFAHCFFTARTQNVASKSNAGAVRVKVSSWQHSFRLFRFVLVFVFRVPRSIPFRFLFTPICSSLLFSLFEINIFLLQVRIVL